MIEIKNLTFGYRRKKPLFDGLSLKFGPGHIHGLLGNNGIGKTTLLKMMCGLILPDAGTIRVSGMDPGKHSPSLYRDLFIIPEEFSLPAITLTQFVRANAPFYPGFSWEAMNHYAGELGVESEARLDKLSMGQKKKAFLSFALACSTGLLLMDEPTNGLDIPSKSVFRKLIAGYADERKTVIISTHQTRDVERLIDNLVILDSSGLFLNNTIDEITRKLRFGAVKEGDEAIYREDTLGGMHGIAVNSEGVDSKINLEILVNAGAQHRETIRKILNS